MAINKESTIWVVVNPTSRSVLVDILFATNLDNLYYYLLGAAHTHEDWMPSTTNLTIYEDEKEALADARHRLADRDEKQRHTACRE